MSKDHVFQFGVFYALLCQCVFGLVPSATNVSVVCHNFVNVLYWNYSSPAEHLRFSVLVKPYLSDAQTIDTSQSYLDISNCSNEADDSYSVGVMAHVGQEKSESVSIDFTYSADYYNEKKHKYKCSLDFPAVNTSVHKDVIEMSFWHPYLFYEQNSMKEDFTYMVTYDQETYSDLCFEDLCTAKIHLNQSMAGRCVELRFEGKIAAIPTHTSRNVCVPQLPPDTDHTGLIVALLGGGTVLLFIIMGVVWVISKKLSKIPKLPETLRSFLSSQSSTTLLSQPEQPVVSPTVFDGHRPLMNELSYDSSPVPPDEKDCETTTDLANTEVDESERPEGDVSDDDFTGFAPSSDYNSPKCLYELGPEDFAEGYGPRPPVI